MYLNSQSGKQFLRELETFVPKLAWTALTQGYPDAIRENLRKAGTSLSRVMSTIDNHPNKNRNRAFFDEVRRAGELLAYVSEQLRINSSFSQG